MIDYFDKGFSGGVACSLGVSFDLGFEASLLPESALPWPAASSPVLLPVSVFKARWAAGSGSSGPRTCPPPTVSCCLASSSEPGVGEPQWLLELGRGPSALGVAGPWGVSLA